MRRSILTLGLLAGVALAGGCTMCDNCQDYTSPVVSVGGYPPGSTPTDAYPLEAVPHEMLPAPQQLPPPPATGRRNQPTLASARR